MFASRLLGPGSEFELSAASGLTKSPPVAGFVEVFPNGVASGEYVVTLTSGATSRHVHMFRAGSVRLLP